MFTDFNNDSLWRYEIATGVFTQFPVPEPADVAVDALGRVWFTVPLEPAIGRLDPATGGVVLTPTARVPRELSVATDGTSGSPPASRRRASGAWSRRRTW